MQEISNLTSNLQTTSQLLGKGISEEHMNIEDRKIGNLKLQTSSLFSMFELFEEEQKSLLNTYYIDAHSSEINQVTLLPVNENENAANDGQRSCVAKKADQTVEPDMRKATAKQQASRVEENCKKKTNNVDNVRKKDLKNIASVEDQQVKEVPPCFKAYHWLSSNDFKCWNSAYPKIQEGTSHSIVQ